MIIVRRVLLGLLLMLALVRAAGYLVYAALILPSPLETYHLEAKMVLLAYRAELGETLYPAWQDYPYVTNFYGPIYFAMVGLIGRAAHADIPGLFRIGRMISFGAGIATSVLLGIIAARRYGRAAGLAGAVLSLATASMIGFSVMTRPDLAAEFLSVIGFFLAVDRRLAVQICGAAVLVLAILTKQTSAIFLIAAALGWIMDGDWRRGLLLGLGGSFAFGLAVAGVTLLSEPDFALALTGESKSPWNLNSWLLTFGRIGGPSPDVFYFSALGLVLWSSRATGRREIHLATLTALLLIMSLVTSAKFGSDVNYYLSLRVVEALAVGAVWHAWTLSTTWLRSTTLLIAGLLGCLLVVPGASVNLLIGRAQLDSYRSIHSSQGRGMLALYREIWSKAADPNFRLLTDSPMIELYQGNRAAFGDPFLFRVMVNTGRIDPKVIRDRIDSSYYELVVLTAEIDTPGYATYEFGLPMTLIERVKARYSRIGSSAGLYLYRPRGTPEMPMGDARSAAGGSESSRP